jgi:hypothetical protein
MTTGPVKGSRRLKANAATKVKGAPKSLAACLHLIAV